MVIGRIYYGLHHEACCRYFRENPTLVPLPIRRRHTELSERYNTLPDSTAKGVGNLLNDLRLLRAQADYELGQMTYRGRPLSTEQCLNASLRLGQRLLEQLDRYSHGEAVDGCNCPTR